MSPLSPVQRVALVALTLGAAGCGGGGTSPEWVDLARGFSPRDNLRPVGGLEFIAHDGRVLTADLDGEEAVLRVTLRADDWRHRRRGGFWIADRTLSGYPNDEAGVFELASGARSFAVDRTNFWTDGPEAADESSFRTGAGTLLLRLPAGEGAPPEATLTCRPNRGEVLDGAWRVTGRRFTGNGLSIWPGESSERVGHLAAPGTLRFATAAETVSSVERPARVRFVVRCNGEDLLAHEQEVGPGGSVAWHALDLPAGRNVLELAVEGDMAYTTFFAPVIGPRDAPADDRPDVVLFQADTFRADNLIAYGGEHRLVPHLDALAEESLLFRRAWSVGTYTLPSHTALLSGLYPHQAGVSSDDVQLADAVETIAEALAEAGWRTGAVTDAVYVSRRFGFDQGFAWFDETNSGLASTFERVRAFLAGDDGRPTFLFVQTYATHTPYEVSAETRAAWRETLGDGLDSDFQAIFDAMAEKELTEDMPAGEMAVFLDRVAKLEALYRGGVVDFDRAFGAFHGELTQAGLLDDAVLLFLSDHGESFFEHGTIYHKGSVMEEQTRVPLFLHGAGIEPRAVDHPVSLIDVVPTIADLAGLEARPDWEGSSLLSLATDRPVYLFECTDRPGSTWGVVEEGVKWVGYEAEPGGVHGVFDLLRDPGEKDDLSATDPGRVDALTRRHREAVERLFTPRHDAAAAELDLEALQGLEDLGYLGGD
jgi:arylsulfatase A-like enzyme